MATHPVRAPGGEAAVRLQALPPLSLYVHLPWCVRKCPYCDFNSYEARGPLADRHYVDALLLERRNGRFVPQDEVDFVGALEQALA